MPQIKWDKKKVSTCIRQWPSGVFYTPLTLQRYGTGVPWAVIRPQKRLEGDEASIPCGQSPNT